MLFELFQTSGAEAAPALTRGGEDRRVVGTRGRGRGAGPRVGAAQGRQDVAAPDPSVGAAQGRQDVAAPDP